MRGTPLAKLRDMFKGEVGSNQTVGTASDKEINTLLSNKQKWLASKWDWPFLKQRYTVTVSPSQRYVNVPNMNWERPVLVEVKWTSIWQKVDYGIGSQEFNYLDSDLGNTQDPVMRWDMTGQLEIPAPTTAPTVANSATAGSLGAGAYSYLVTFVTPFGETSAGPVSANTTPGLNKSIDLTLIPVAPQGTVEGVSFPEVTARNIYRTTSAGSSYKFLASINDNLTTTYHDGAADATLGSAPPTYSTAEATVMEIWPLPVSQQQMMFTGQRLLNPLEADTDTADLDDMLLVLYVAADWLARKKQADAGAKLREAELQLNSVRSNYPRRTRKVNLAGKPNGAVHKIVPFKIIAVK